MNHAIFGSKLLISHLQVLLCNFVTMDFFLIWKFLKVKWNYLCGLCFELTLPFKIKAFFLLALNSSLSWKLKSLWKSTIVLIQHCKWCWCWYHFLFSFFKVENMPWKGCYAINSYTSYNTERHSCLLREIWIILLVTASSSLRSRSIAH